MIKFMGRWIGFEHIGEEELAKLRKPAERAVVKATLYFEKAIKKRLSGPRHGRDYGTHIASAPGEAPATNTGAFRQSITHTMPVWDGDNVWAQVGTDAAQAHILEYGGITGRGYHTRILPRPLWAVTWMEEEPAIDEILNGAVKSTDGRERDELGRFI